MGPLKIAFACLLAASISAVAYASSDDLPHWNPGKATIAKLDFTFRNAGRWHGSPPAIDRYNRYYTGVTIKGRRTVRAEFTIFPETEIVDGKVEYRVDKNPVHVVPVDRFPLIVDAGCSGVINMLYDVDADRMIRIDC